MIAACIFDLDGVVVDTARYHFLAWRRLSQELGVNFTESDNERLKGVSRMRSLEIILELGGLHADELLKETYAEQKNAWFVDYLKHMKPDEIFPGVRELLLHLRGNGQKLGLASSSRNAMMVVETLGIAELFDTIVDGTMIVKSKPDPEIFLLAADQLNTRASQCLVFEDAAAGVEAAIAAGMMSVGIGDRSILGGAQMVIAHTADFTTGDLEKF